MSDLEAKPGASGRLFHSLQLVEIAMPRVLFGNFDFEHELADRSYNRSKRLARINAELTPHLLALARPGDAVWFPEPVPAAFFEEAIASGLPEVIALGPDAPGPDTPGLASKRQDLPDSDVPGSNDDAPSAGFEFVPWGWSPPATTVARSQKLRNWQLPARCDDLLAAARIGNSRAFSAGLECELDIGLPGAVPVATVDQLDAALRGCETVKWLVKAEFGMSARERISGSGGVISEPAHRWLERRFARGETLYFEPFVESLLEVSTHWEIGSIPGNPCRSIRCAGATRLLNDASGQFLASRVIPLKCFESGSSDLSENDVSAILNAAREAAHRLSDCGYAGPIGIDAMLYRRPSGERCLRPLQDINARWSMGRIACEWQQRFCPDSEAVWSLAAPEVTPPGLDAGNRGVVSTSPLMVGNAACQRVGRFFRCNR